MSTPARNIEAWLKTHRLTIWSQEHLDTAPPDLRKVMHWVDSFIVKSHPDLGRTGPVCPFVPPALRLDSLRLALIEERDLSESEICDRLARYLRAYQEMEPKEGDLLEFKTLILIFPGIPAHEADSVIRNVHAAMKPTFVEAGLMLGEFYKDHHMPGLYNPDFRPLRSPVPLFVCRQMVLNDVVFLSRPADDPARRVIYLQAYLRTLDRKLTAAHTQRAHAMIEKAQAEILHNQSKQCE